MMKTLCLVFAIVCVATATRTPTDVDAVTEDPYSSMMPKSMMPKMMNPKMPKMPKMMNPKMPKTPKMPKMGGGSMGGGSMGGGSMGGGSMMMPKMMGGGSMPKMGGGSMGGGSMPKMGGGSMGGGSMPKMGGMTTPPKGGNMNGGGNNGGAQMSTGGTWHGKGVDVSQPCGNWACLKSSGYSFAVIRIFQETGSVDSNGVNSIKAAQAAGLSTDVYMYPAGTKSTTGKAQATAVLNALKGVRYGRVWIDVEGVGKSWTTNSASNVQLFKDIANTLTAGGAQIGVYTQGWQWNSIMGSSTAGSSYPVWYAEYGAGPGHYTTADGTCSYAGAPASLASFKAFGGWTHAYAKQYNGDCNKCGCSVDVNFAP